MNPLAIDLYCGLGGWAEGFLSEGYDVVGFDIERHDYVTGVYPGQLVIQDVLTLHGSQFKRAAVIVASPPCQAYSYRAMPWKKAKALPPPNNTLFEVCFRIQREACEAAGRHIPLIVENVKGAQVWVGRARWHCGSFYLWGDVPALMPIFKHFKASGMNWSDRTKHGQDFTRVAGNQAVKHDGSGWRANGTLVSNNRLVIDKPFAWNGNEELQALRRNQAGVKLQGNKNGSWFGEYGPGQGSRNTGSKSKARRAASAHIAKIPFPLAVHIAKCFK